MYSNSDILMARSLRLAVIQNQYDQGNLTEDEAKELLSGPLTPEDKNSVFDDSDQLRIKLSPVRVDNFEKGEANARAV